MLVVVTPDILSLSALIKMTSEEVQLPSQSALSAPAPLPAHSQTPAPTESDDADDLMLR